MLRRHYFFFGVLFLRQVAVHLFSFYCIMSQHSSNIHTTWSSAGLLITLGIIFGDIGTSPLYVMKAILGTTQITQEVLFGAVSCIFWTLTLQTTLKYILLTLSADNHGEGGILALFALVKRTKVTWLIYPAIIGAGTLLADSIITPPISVSTAIEGIKDYFPELNTVPIVIVILFFLFAIQQFGTTFIGKFFGPIMFFWFAMLGILGGIQLAQAPQMVQAINPYYAIKLLQAHPEGFFVLGLVFLCTTGAESIYSDMGHCGRKNIRISWIFVKVMLLCNYFGQAAYLLQYQGQTLQQVGGKYANPFYLIMPDWFQPIGIVLATMAAVIASQALITGSYTLINEAVRLGLWPKVKIKYPTVLKGQLYIPSINWLLFVGCVVVMLHFKESKAMEGAYGLAIIFCMMMTTILLNFYLIMKRVPWYTITGIIAFYGVLESSFLIANLKKFTEGGYFSIAVALIAISIMYIHYKAKGISRSYTRWVNLKEYTPVLKALSKDFTIPKYATHLVYMTNATKSKEVEEKCMISILHKRPKRADIYWFIHVNILNEPYKKEYRVTTLQPETIFRVDFYLGFREPTKINLMFREVVRNMVENGEVDVTSRYESLNKNNILGDFKFVIVEKYLSYDNFLKVREKLILETYFFIKRFGLSEERAFGLDTSSVKVEKFPLVVHTPERMNLDRIGNS